MSATNSDDWVSDDDDDIENEASDVANEPGSNLAEEPQFPRRSVDEVQSDTANPHRRSSSISSGLAAMSPAELASARPRQPTPPPPRRSSTLPDQIKHDPSHDRARSPKTSLPDYHDPDSPTQRRGPGIPRNPVSDTWREDAYLKKEASDRKISPTEASKMQDRWRCENCSTLSGTGTETTATRADPDDPRVGVAGPSTAPPGPIRIPYYQLPGVTYARCRVCGEILPRNPAEYDPRELSEDGMKWDLVDEVDELPAAKLAMMINTKRRARQRVLFKWSEDERRARSESRKAKQRQREEEEARSPLGWTVRPGSGKRAEDAGGGAEERGEDEAGGGDAQGGDEQGDDHEWEDDNAPDGPQQ